MAIRDNTEVSKVANLKRMLQNREDVTSYRAVATTTDRERISGEADVPDAKVYEAISRVRNRIEELERDYQLFQDHHPDLARELEDAVLGQRGRRRWRVVFHSVFDDETAKYVDFYATEVHGPDGPALEDVEPVETGRQLLDDEHKQALERGLQSGARAGIYSVPSRGTYDPEFISTVRVGFGTVDGRPTVTELAFDDLERETDTGILHSL